MDNLNLLDNVTIHSNVTIGNLAEQKACAFLENHGLQLLEKNFSVINENGKKIGEIDLIMRDKNYYVFIEVKKRQNPAHGDVLEMISKSKKSRIIRTATHYLLRHCLWNFAYCRFDVIGITPEKITWIKDAFQVQY